ncbi:uncharacterized protein LOC142981137 [Anticarsia gemmatalis]|uniref:uncharacterized protein LOC142981137 n=1 Tax=Anticarsia gemmatalis TaxID=129554 RepID=UPI003F76E8F7
MDVYKDFIYRMRKLECEKPYLIVLDEYPPSFLRGYVKTIIGVPLKSDAYNAYYGEIKKEIYSFLNFYVTCIGNVTKLSDAYKHELKNTKMMELIDNTIRTHEDSQEEFVENFKPINSPSEQKMFDEIATINEAFMAELNQFRDYLVSIVKKEHRIKELIVDHFEIGVNKTSEICNFAHIYIAKLLADRINEIRISLEDQLLRLRNNMHTYHESYEEHLNGLYNEMYDLNKERLFIARRTRQNSVDTAEVEKSIDKVRGKIEKFGNYETFARLDLETNYWSRKLRGFEEVASIVTKVKKALDKMTEEEKIFDQFETTELSCTKEKCWDAMGKNFKESKADLEEKYIDACRALITFFSCRGTDRILYSDHIGAYFVDEYGHQNYITNYGEKFYHIDCDGHYKENLESEKYYFDQSGRYILDGDKRIYQVAPCTSHYKLNEQGLLEKTTVDCGHSNKPNEKCRLEIRDLTDVELLPKTEVIDIERTLDAETVKYLWDTFGWILPEVLNEVGTHRTKNPIHYFGHVLLQKRYSMTTKEVKQKKEEAEQYRADLHKKRKDKLEAAKRIWRRKRCPDTEIDYTPQLVAYSAYQQERQYVTDLTRYYYDDLY